jgi:hypothetical protein
MSSRPSTSLVVSLFKLRRSAVEAAWFLVGKARVEAVRARVTRAYFILAKKVVLSSECDGSEVASNLIVEDVFVVLDDVQFAAKCTSFIGTTRSSNSSDCG